MSKEKRPPRRVPYSTPPFNPAVEKANKYDNYTTKVPAIILPANAGTTSRAYANAHGSQAGLNVPNSTRATQGQIQKTPSGYVAPGGNGGAGSSGGIPTPATPLFVPKTADLSQNPYPLYYDKLLAYVQANANARPAEFDAMGAKFKTEQSAADQQLYDAYQGSRVGTDASATALGVDPAIVSQARDLAMRKSQENSDQSLADNLAWLTKMGSLAKQQGEASYGMYAGEEAQGAAKWAAEEQSRVAAQNLADLQALVAAQSGGSGGGGGGRGGGGSSSGNITDTASEEGQLYTGGMDLELYSELAKTDPAAAAAYMNMYNSTMSSAGVKAAQDRVNTLTTQAAYKGVQVQPKKRKGIAGMISNPLNVAMAAAHNIPVTAKTGQASAAKKQLPVYKKVLDAMIATSGNWGNPKVVKKTTSKSSAKRS